LKPEDGRGKEEQYNGRREGEDLELVRSILIWGRRRQIRA
jgi:hypothetical protein